MSEKKGISDIAERIETQHGIDRKSAEAFVREMFEVIEQTLATERFIKVKGLGTFKLIEVEARESVDVNTGERIEIEGHKKISFTPDTALKRQINKPFEHFETVLLHEGAQLADTPVEELNPADDDADVASEEYVDEAALETEVADELATAPVVEEQLATEEQSEEPSTEEQPEQPSTEEQPEQPTTEQQPEHPATEPEQPTIEEHPIPEATSTSEEAPTAQIIAENPTEKSASRAFGWVKIAIIVLLLLCIAAGLYLYLRL